MRILPALATLMLGGCVVPPPGPRVVLDQRTGASMTIVDQPLVLARERRDVAVQARDYITLVAAEINESGRRRLVWVAHQWSTIDARATDFQPTRGALLVLVADGRDLRLLPVADAAAADFAENRALLPPDDANVTTTVYAVDAATLDYVATSSTLSAAFPESRLALPFAVWTDGRPALLRFLAQTVHTK
ncbi:MAG: hypothetical protein ABI769_03960 [Pseudomonadota bacterium]